MGRTTHFNSRQSDYLLEALEIAEILSGKYYAISARDWERYPYDIRTLKQLDRKEVTDKGFAQLAKYSLGEYRPHRKYGINDFYRICVQDHVILSAVDRDDQILLRPLLLYTITHELVHIIRFNQFAQDYHAGGEKRNWEERAVHGITSRLLQDFQYEGLEEVIGAYEWARADAPP